MYVWQDIPSLYISGIGEVRTGDYIVAGNKRINWGYDKLYVSSYKDLPYSVVGDDLLIERKNIVYKEKDYWKEFLHKIIPFLNSDEEEQ